MGGLPFLGRCVNNIARYNSAAVVQEDTVTTAADPFNTAPKDLAEVCGVLNRDWSLLEFCDFAKKGIGIRSFALEWEPR